MNIRHKVRFDVSKEAWIQVAYPISYQIDINIGMALRLDVERKIRTIVNGTIHRPLYGALTS